MINYCIYNLVRSLELLRAQEVAVNQQQRDYRDNVRAGMKDDPGLDQSTLDITKGIIEKLRVDCDALEINEAGAQIDDMLYQIQRPTYLLEDCGADLRAIRKTIERHLKDRHFYYYPIDRAKLLLSVDEEWKDVFIKFKSAKEDIRSAVDCYAIGHCAASIFHLMRTVEIGLCALAQERGVVLNRPIEYANWEKIIEKAKESADSIAKTKVGPQRDVALSFYRTALVHLDYFKDDYRNHVMHTRESYDGPRTRGVLNHVREFMLGLSTKLSDKATGPINWGIP